MPKAPEPPTPVILRENCIVDSVFYSAGTPVPFASESDLPPNLKGLAATGEEDFFHPRERDFYSPDLKREARQVLGNCLYQESAEDFLARENQLPPETEAALADSHSLRIARLRAQMEYDRGLSDDAYLIAAGEAEAKTPKFHVRRGADFVPAEKAELVPAEHVFSKQPNGEFWVVGTVDAYGELPPEGIIP